ncbi:MAG TPA: export ABC transporter ATP-binding protein [Acidimicrobiaceae bacterium]|nr:export ABC transporter ATP-binding protein [Acidimicrobiaceae bacterium]
MTVAKLAAAPRTAVAPEPTGPVLSCAGLVKRFAQRTAVDGIGFQVDAGEIYGLLGPNGAGKTTTIKMVCGLLDADAGVVTIGGRPLAELSVRALVGYVPQDIALYPDLTARENLAFLGRLYGLRAGLLDERIAEALELTGLSDRDKDRVEAYSGGMKRRLNIAAGLLHHPKLLVLDEPTVGVDPQSRHAILERVQALGDSGMAVVYTTHYMEEADRVCDRVGIIDRGRLIAEGTKRQLVSRLGEKDRIDLVASGDLQALAASMRGVTGVESAAAAADRVHVVAADGRSVLPDLVEAAERSGATLTSVEVSEADLESVFLNLTGTALRE